jgi:threonyl-tRNA synthetase
MLSEPHEFMFLTDAIPQQLKRSLDKHYPGKWELNPGDGAFYGPKIDITIRDALRRSFQCATIQLDFQLPERFNLKYRSAEEFMSPDKPPSRPVIIHRAILGSLERFMAIITEHFAGKWYVVNSTSDLTQADIISRPFWLSPRQVVVIPVAVPFVCLQLRIWIGPHPLTCTGCLTAE